MPETATIKPLKGAGKLSVFQVIGAAIYACRNCDVPAEGEEINCRRSRTSGEGQITTTISQDPNVVAQHLPCKPEANVNGSRFGTQVASSPSQAGRAPATVEQIKNVLNQREP